MQENQFDDELKRMDELEHDKSSGIGEGVSLDDSLSGLALPQPIVVNAGTSLNKAIQKLQKRSLGCLLVERDSKLIGIMTERDILLKITGKGMNFDKEIVIMHPGPINRGVEITSDVADSKQSIILNQVENGVAIRMAVIYLLASKIK